MGVASREAAAMLRKEFDSDAKKNKKKNERRRRRRLWSCCFRVVCSLRLLSQISIHSGIRWRDGCIGCTLASCGRIGGGLSCTRRTIWTICRIGSRRRIGSAPWMGFVLGIIFQRIFLFFGVCFPSTDWFAKYTRFGRFHFLSLPNIFPRRIISLFCSKAFFFVTLTSQLTFLPQDTDLPNILLPLRSALSFLHQNSSHTANTYSLPTFPPYSPIDSRFNLFPKVSAGLCAAGSCGQFRKNALKRE